MLGVVHEAVVFLLEQLYGTRHCRSYRFRFHKPEETDEPPINPHGSARAEVHHRSVWYTHTHTPSDHEIVEHVSGNQKSVGAEMALYIMHTVNKPYR